MWLGPCNQSALFLHCIGCLMPTSVYDTGSSSCFIPLALNAIIDYLKSVPTGRLFAYGGFILSVLRPLLTRLVLLVRLAPAATYIFFFFKKGHPRPLFNLFSSFQTNITMFTSNTCEKCPSSIQCWDSNPWPSGHESPPITTRPGLPPK